MLLQKMLNFLHHFKKEIITLLVVFLCLFLAISFPHKDEVQLLSSIIFFLIIFPILFIKVVLKKNLSSFGLNFSEKKRGFLWASLMLLLSFLITLILFYFFELETRYILPDFIANNFWAFVFYEMLAMNAILFVFEFFFRGFIQFSLEKSLGYWAVVVQFFIFIGFLFFIQKLDWQYAPLIILSLLGGIVAYKSKSFVYSYLMGIVFMLFFDVYIINLLK